MLTFIEVLLKLDGSSIEGVSELHGHPEFDQLRSHGKHIGNLFLDPMPQVLAIELKRSNSWCTMGLEKEHHAKQKFHEMSSFISYRLVRIR